ncbi:hypothetical protein I656_03006 [Geobacillus sp. WSUCF1]|nr:hypothetical protein I656_03006 [Geobacillus sp. WSUCF1]
MALSRRLGEMTPDRAAAARWRAAESRLLFSGAALFYSVCFSSVLPA